MNVVIDSILLESTDPFKLAEFYRGGLGLEEPDTVLEGQIGFQIGDIYLGMERVEEASTPSKSVSLWFHVEDVEATYDRLLSLGATSKAAPEAVDDETVASVFDPDGNFIGLISYDE